MGSFGKSILSFFKEPETPNMLTSPWMPFPILIAELSKILPANIVRSIFKYHSNHIERKVSKNELIKKVRQLAGNRLLISVIKSIRAKQLRCQPRAANDKNATTSPEHPLSAGSSM